MKIFIWLSAFISFAYAAASPTYDLLINKHSDHRTALCNDKTIVYTKGIRACKIAIMKKLISMVLGGEDNNERIAFLEKDYDKYLNISAEVVEATIHWDAIFTDEQERKIKCDIEKSDLKDDFSIRFNVIINELSENMHRYIAYGFADEFYSYEMINILEFLQEMRHDYFLHFQFKIIEMLIDFLLVHFYKASGLTDEGTTNKIKERIMRIKQSDNEIRDMKSRSSESLIILNDIVEGIPDLDLIMINIYVPNISKSRFTNTNVLNCHEIETKINDLKFITRKRPRLIFINTIDPIDMWRLYVNLENLKKKWKSGKYTDLEFKFIFALYLVEFSTQHHNVIDTFINASQCNIGLPKMQINHNCRLFSFILTLIPGNFMNVLKKWNRYRNHNGRYLMIDYEYIRKIIEFREHLLNLNTDISFNNLSDLEPEVVFKSIKVVIGYHQAYLGYQYKECKKITGISTYDLEAMNDICRIIAYHLETIDIIVFRNDIEKYINLCYILKRLSHKNIECSMSNDSISLIDYPALLEFYEEYSKIGLYIGCIYNINFLLGRSAKGDVLWLHSEDSLGEKGNDFFDDAYEFTVVLEEINYKIFTYDEEIYCTLRNIMECLIVFKNSGHMLV